MRSTPLSAWPKSLPSPTPYNTSTSIESNSTEWVESKYEPSQSQSLAWTNQINNNLREKLNKS